MSSTKTTAIPSKVAYIQNPVSAAQVHALGGFVGERWLANRSGSIQQFDISYYVRMLESPTHKDWWWIGEQPGKWLESAVLTCATDPGDPSLPLAIQSILSRIVAAQSPDGYLGITDPSLRTPHQPLRGMDPYEQYFTFHGLITAYELLNDKSALSAATRLASYYLDHIGPGKAEFWPSPVRPPENRHVIICKQWTWVPEGTARTSELYWQSSIAGHTAHYGWEGTLIIDPILRLYEITGEPRFLEFARWVVSRIDAWSGWDAFSRLDDVAAGTAGVHQLQPYVHAHTFHMNFLGFLRLYRITGDESLLRKVLGAWEDIARRQMYITGGVSASEHYKPGCDRPLTGHVVETCANMSWMQLTQELLQITGQPRFADAIERLLLNHVFASQTVDGDCYRYHTPPNGSKPSGYFHGPDCCTSSGHRLVSLLPTFLYTTTSDAITINQYVPSTAEIPLPTGQTAILWLTTTYPQDELISVTLLTDPAIEFTLRFRIPAWCQSPTVSINAGAPTPAQPGTYVAIRRHWSPGDRIDLRLPMTPTWVEHSPPLPDRRLLALQRGPVIYALDTLWWDSSAPPAPSAVDTSVRIPTAPPPQLEPVALPPGVLGPGYRTAVNLDGNVLHNATFVPFANVGRWYPANAPRPVLSDGADGNAYSYAIWLNAAD